MGVRNLILHLQKVIMCTSVSAKKNDSLLQTAGKYPLSCRILGWSSYLSFIVILTGSRSPLAVLTSGPKWEVVCKALSYSTPRHVLISGSPGTSAGNLSTTLRLWSAGFFSTFFFVSLVYSARNRFKGWDCLWLSRHIGPLTMRHWFLMGSPSAYCIANDYC